MNFYLCDFFTDVKKKWKSLKDMYRKEVKKIPLSRSGETAMIDAEVKWKYFKLLAFIKDEIVPTDGDLIVQKDSLTQDSVNDNETLNLDAVTIVEPKLEQKELDRTEQAQNSTQTPIIQQDATQIIDQMMPSPIASTSTNNSVPARKRQTPADRRAEYLEIERKKLRIMELELSRNNDFLLPEQKSEDYHFLMSILPTIERLPPMQKIRLRNKINQVVLEEMEMFNYRDQCGHQQNYGYKLDHVQTHNNYNVKKK